MKKIYFFKNYIKYSGYDVTMNRIASYFYNSEFIITSEKLNDPNNIVFFIDAYKAGLILSNRKCKYIILIGLKDLNSYVKDESKFSVVKSCLKKAARVIVFDEFMKIDLSLQVPFINDNKVSVVSQAVSRILVKPFNLRSYLGIHDNRPLFVMIGLQSDPLYLDQVFNFLYNVDKTTLIVINKVSEEKVTFSDNVKIIKNLDRSRIHSVLQQVDGLINCSINETMNNTILEAMKIGCPVYARRNLGTMNLICNYINGFIFETPEEFVKLRKLDTSYIITEASKLVNDNYDYLEEKKAYLDIIIELTKIKKAII